MDSEVEPVSSNRFRRAGSDRTAYAKAMDWNVSWAFSFWSSDTLSGRGGG